MNEMTQVAGEHTSPFKQRYDNFTGGTFVPPVNGRYFDNITPITGQKVCDVARSDAADVELALDAAHAAKGDWGQTSAAERSNILLKVADRLEENLDLLARAETWDTASRSARRRMPTFRSRSTISAISPGSCAARRARCRKSTPTPWPITTTNPSASWARSSRGTSRF